MSESNRQQQQQKQGPLGPQQSEKSTQDLQEQRAPNEQGAETQHAPEQRDTPDVEGLSDAHVERLREKGFKSLQKLIVQ